MYKKNRLRNNKSVLKNLRRMKKWTKTQEILITRKAKTKTLIILAMRTKRQIKTRTLLRQQLRRTAQTVTTNIRMKKEPCQVPFSNS